jgi:phosphatidylserine decarboxylase
MEIWNRRKGRREKEDVYGDFFVRLLYGNPLGFALADSLLVRKAVSRLYGRFQSAPASARKVAPFVEKFRVPMEQFEPGPFGSFNEFFVRRFRPGQRPFPENPDLMGAFAEARYLAFRDTSLPVALPVKGLGIAPEALLGATPGKERFHGGPCLLARLCPVDYHRFHFPDSGRIAHRHRETGKLHSVNPLALARHPDLFLENERRISLLETEHFGRLAYVEVGALCVGRIVETHPEDKPFRRGSEKGYFLFGASTVVVYGEPGAWEPSRDLLENSAKGLETLVELGQPVAEKRRSL